MSNRILKASICGSPTLDGLTPFQEICFYRLIVNCDDYGRFDARPAMLRSCLFPLKTDLPLEEVTAAVYALEAAGLLMFYEVEGMPYLQLRTWERHQRIRTQRGKYPAPNQNSDNLPQIAAACGNPPQPAADCGLNPIQSESESKSESKSESESESEPRCADCTPESVIVLYSELCPDLRPCKKLNPARRKKLEDLIAEGRNREYWHGIFTRAQSSGFLRGDRGKGWKANIDFFLQAENLEKIDEGNYDDPKPRIAPGLMPSPPKPTGALPLLERQAIARMLEEAAKSA